MFPQFIQPNIEPNRAILPPLAPQSTPMILPQRKKNPLFSVNYVRQPKAVAPVAPVVQARVPKIPLVREAIAHNETRGEKEPYKFSRFSGSKVLGKALGRYQVTEGELDTYAERFLGHPVTAATFLSNPEIQDQYIENKIEYLINKKLPLEKVLVAHRGGFSNFDALDAKIAQYKGYVDEGLTAYDNFEKQTNAGGQ